MRRLDEIDRAGVRAAFEERFTVERMARDYVGVYERLIASWPDPSAATSRAGAEAFAATV